MQNCSAISRQYSSIFPNTGVGLILLCSLTIYSSNAYSLFITIVSRKKLSVNAITL